MTDPAASETRRSLVARAVLGIRRVREMPLFGKRLSIYLQKRGDEWLVRVSARDLWLTPAMARTEAKRLIAFAALAADPGSQLGEYE